MQDMADAHWLTRREDRAWRSFLQMSGVLRYQVGAYAFEEYWETNYGGKREIHARRTGLVPFVALKVVHARDRAKPQP